MSSIGTAARREDAEYIAHEATRPRLINRDPLLHAIAESLKAYLSVCGKISLDAGAQPSIVSIF